MPAHRRYTQEEDDFISANYRAMSYRAIGCRLDRSRKAITARAQRLGLHKLKRWTDAEDQVIRDSTGRLLAEVAQQLGRGISEVSSRWAKIGDGSTWRSRGGYRPDNKGRPVIGYERRNGYSQRIMEHRFNMEQHLGRTLSPGEIVHHINGIKTDCGIENLFLCESRSGHRKVHFSFEQLLPYLLERGVIGFDRDRGVYYLCETSK